MLMARGFAALLFAALAGCAQPEPIVPALSKCEPFSGVRWDLMSDSDRRSLKEASADFCAVLAGDSPIHAKLDAKFMPSGNGDTRRFLGHGYKITAVRRIGFVGGVLSAVVGPVLQLDGQMGPDGPVEVSQLRVVGLPPTP